MKANYIIKIEEEIEFNQSLVESLKEKDPYRAEAIRNFIIGLRSAISIIKEVYNEDPE